jgi:diguanylate cyclase (GGDEF)-like protein
MSNLANLNIIIIDDNQSIRKDFISILTKKSESPNELQDVESKLFGEIVTSTLPEFRIETASQGQEGIEKIAKAYESGSPYALAFVDIRMPPGFDGVETIKRIWKIDQDMQIVICTAYSDYTWEQTVDQLGQRENLLILKKPFDHIAVRQLSCALTRKWQLLQENREHTHQLQQQVAERTSSLQQSLSITRATLESSVNGILVVNNENSIIDFNKKIIEIWHIEPFILESKDAKVLFEYLSLQIDNHDGFLNMVTALTDKPNAIQLDQFKCGNKTFEIHSQPYKIHEKIAGRIWSFRDITKRAIFEKKLKYQATHDTLTGLPNRVLLTERIAEALEKIRRYKTKFGILFFDLDRFKLVNDSLSHAIGDELLQAVANRIKLALRGEDTFARIGGDEFVIVAESAQDGEDIGRIALKMLDSFAKPFEIANCNILISASIGISISPLDGTTPDDLLSKADIAMYRSKEQGGNQFQFFTEELGKRSIERLGNETELRQAIANKEFFLCYQPQVDATKNQLQSVEALVRWKHPTRGIILPLEFIPLAEETGLITPLSEWILREACMQNKRWQNQGFTKIMIAVNIANHQIKHGDLPNTIRKILQETGLEPQYLELELSENIIINNANIISVVTELKNIGVHIALDDFGSGCSSLNYLRQIPIDRLKIDKSFVQNIATNSGDEVIIQAIISMAHDLNLDVLAEGVETQEQLNFLKMKKCESIQGDYFSKPLSVKDMEELLKNPAH